VADKKAILKGEKSGTELDILLNVLRKRAGEMSTQIVRTLSGNGKGKGIIKGLRGWRKKLTRGTHQH